MWVIKWNAYYTLTDPHPLNSNARPAIVKKGLFVQVDAGLRTPGRPGAGLGSIIGEFWYP